MSPEIFLGDVNAAPSKGSKDYDVIIIGGGPAGLTAAMYTGRSKCRTLVIEKMACGGQIIITDWVDNFPTYEEGIGGFELGRKLEAQARKFGAEILMDIVESISDGPEWKVVRTSDAEYRARSVIIATGAIPRKLDVPGETGFTGRGVSYCATCDGAFFKGKEVVVIGGGDTAVQEAVFLTRFAEKVRILHRRDKLRAVEIIQEKAFSNTKVSFIWNSVVEEIKGGKTVESVRVKNLKTGAVEDLKTDGVFVFVGIHPQTEFLKGVLELDPEGYIPVNFAMQTTIPGFFACGDVIVQKLRQVATAVGEGATAAVSAQEFAERF
jgi:thioredoxin reductase (NADPH)